MQGSSLSHRPPASLSLSFAICKMDQLPLHSYFGRGNTVSLLGGVGAEGGDAWQAKYELSFYLHDLLYPLLPVMCSLRRPCPQLVHLSCVHLLRRKWEEQTHEVFFGSAEQHS